MLWWLKLCPRPRLESLITAFSKTLNFGEKYEMGWKRKNGRGNKKKGKKKEKR